MAMSEAPAARLPQPPAVARERLLIVDDEPALLEALCKTLAERGYETQGFTQAQAALAALHEHDFDVLLCDLMMPGMDGIALLRAALEIDPNLVGIIMTGTGDGPDSGRGDASRRLGLCPQAFPIIGLRAHSDPGFTGAPTPA